MSRIDLTKLYQFLVDTLVFASTPMENLDDITIEDRLEELESDAHVFLYKGNLEKLKNKGLLTNMEVKQIEELKDKIKAIPSELWRVEEFKYHHSWIVIHKLSDSILSTMPSS